MKFWKCSICGKILCEVKGTPVPTICCGEPMQELTAGSVDASLEKHVPVYSVAAGKVSVKVGSAPHPMEEKHFIEWIALETKAGCQLRHLAPGAAAEAVFCIADGEEVVAVYAYCNLHSLWKA